MISCWSQKILLEMTHAPATKQNGDTQRPKHPDIDGGWGWWVVFASFMIHIVSKLNNFLVFCYYELSTWFIWFNQWHTKLILSQIFFLPPIDQLFAFIVKKYSRELRIIVRTHNEEFHTSYVRYWKNSMQRGN